MLFLRLVQSCSALYFETFVAWFRRMPHAKSGCMRTPQTELNSRGLSCWRHMVWRSDSDVWWRTSLRVHRLKLVVGQRLLQRERQTRAHARDREHAIVGFSGTLFLRRIPDMRASDRDVRLQAANFQIIIRQAVPWFVIRLCDEHVRLPKPRAASYRVQWQQPFLVMQEGGDFRAIRYVTCRYTAFPPEPHIHMSRHLHNGRTVMYRLIICLMRNYCTPL